MGYLQFLRPVDCFLFPPPPWTPEQLWGIPTRMIQGIPEVSEMYIKQQKSLWHLRTWESSPGAA